MKKNKLIFFLVLSILSAKAQTTDSIKFMESNISAPLKDITLYGTLTMPATAKKKVPIVFIIAGSGATDRNGNNIAAGLNADAYKQLAHVLAVNNIASLRYDKRGVGESKPIIPASAPKLFDTEVNDAMAMIDLIKNDKRFSKLIIAGHSQGALIGILAAKDANKFISLSGVGLKGSVTLRNQLAEQPAIVSETANPIIDSLENGFFVSKVPQFLEPLFKKSIQPYVISWFKYDPAIELSKLKIPSLIIQGDNDIQIGVADAQKFVSISPKSKLFIIQGMNHMFKIVPVNKEENIKSYSNPNLPISDKLIDVIKKFIAK